MIIGGRRSAWVRGSCIVSVCFYVKTTNTHSLLDISRSWSLVLERPPSDPEPHELWLRAAIHAYATSAVGSDYTCSTPAALGVAVHAQQYSKDSLFCFLYILLFTITFLALVPRSFTKM